MAPKDVIRSMFEGDREPQGGAERRTRLRGPVEARVPNKGLPEPHRAIEKCECGSWRPMEAVRTVSKPCGRPSHAADGGRPGGAQGMEVPGVRG